MKPRLILASESPRRKQLLEEAGYEFEVDPAGIDEPEPNRRDVTVGLRGPSGVAQGRRSREAAIERADPGGRHRSVSSTARSSTNRSTGPTPSG